MRHDRNNHLARRALLGAVLLASATRVARAAPQPFGRDASANRALLQAMVNDHPAIELPPGQIPIDGPVFVRRSGLRIAGNPDGTTELVLVGPRNPIFVLGSKDEPCSGVTITHLGFLGATPREPMMSVEQDKARDPMGLRLPLRIWQTAVLQTNGGALQLRHCRFDNFDACVFLLGNHWVRTELAEGFLIEDCTMRSADFGVLAKQFRNARISGLHGSRTTRRGRAEPHLIYITDRGAARSDGLLIENLTDEDNPIAPASSSGTSGMPS
jgi:hypothetical protein